ncbi:MAG: MTH1187 family thiamine-binding protein [Prolixibacteraceae bacterium]|nr:MTH1187 family thiamine-binding protein [Prolixibacteraceae bacterium]
MKNIINAAIQVLPRSSVKGTYELVDLAIEKIQSSGLNYRVCPFETVVEGSFDEVMRLIKEIHEAVYDGGADEMITNIKIQTRHNQDVFIEDKMSKYE